MSRAYWAKRRTHLDAPRGGRVARRNRDLPGRTRRGARTYADPVRRNSRPAPSSPGNPTAMATPTRRDSPRDHPTAEHHVGSLTGISATLNSATPGVTMLTGNATYPTIAAGQSATNATSLEYRLARACLRVCGPVHAGDEQRLGRFTNSYTRLIGRPRTTLRSPTSSTAGTSPSRSGYHDDLLHQLLPGLLGHVSTTSRSLSARITRRWGTCNWRWDTPTAQSSSRRSCGRELSNYGRGACGMDRCDDLRRQASTTSARAGRRSPAGIAGGSPRRSQRRSPTGTGVCASPTPTTMIPARFFAGRCAP